MRHPPIALAIFPLRLRESHPLPKGWLPKPSQRKAMSYIYPDEDRALLGCPAIPLAHRVFYGVLTREGMRKSEAMALCWSDVDSKRGAIALDENVASSRARVSTTDHAPASEAPCSVSPHRSSAPFRSVEFPTWNQELTRTRRSDLTRQY